MHLVQHWLCTRKIELALQVKFISTFSELHVHGDERWPTEVTSNAYFRGVTLRSALRHFKKIAAFLVRVLLQNIRGPGRIHDAPAHVHIRARSRLVFARFPRRDDLHALGRAQAADGPRSLAPAKLTSDRLFVQFKHGVGVCGRRLGFSQKLGQAADQQHDCYQHP